MSEGADGADPAGADPAGTEGTDPAAGAAAGATGADPAAGAVEFDVTPYVMEGTENELNLDAVKDLHSKFENEAKSKSYYQSLSMKKTGSLETAEDYINGFKPDSSYEKHFGENDKAKADAEELANFCKENDIGQREYNLIQDLYLKKQVESGRIDSRTETQIQADTMLAKDKALKEVQPMLDGLHRSKEENDQVIENFLKSPNMFTNAGEDMVKTLNDIVGNGVEGYKFMTLLAQSVEHQGIPVVTGSISSGDSAALQKALAAEADPVARQQLMKEFYKEN